MGPSPWDPKELDTTERWSTALDRTHRRHGLLGGPREGPARTEASGETKPGTLVSTEALHACEFWLMLESSSSTLKTLSKTSFVNDPVNLLMKVWGGPL